MGNTKHTKEQIRERIQQKKLLFDGAFGTYYGGKYDTEQLPELASPGTGEGDSYGVPRSGSADSTYQHLRSQQLLHG